MVILDPQAVSPGRTIRRQGDLRSFTEPVRSAAEMGPGLLTAVEGLFRVEAPLADGDCPTGQMEDSREARFPLGFPRTWWPCGEHGEAEQPSEKE